MTNTRRRDTTSELALRRAVHALGLRYRVDVRPVPAIRRHADLVFPRAKVAVFLDGCFWHGCPEHIAWPRRNEEYWRSKIERTRVRDLETNAWLEASGWRVVRVWEHEAPSEGARRVANVVELEV
jgi:DNA mismatch endonuclease (patch repair protein)